LAFGDVTPPGKKKKSPSKNARSPILTRGAPLSYGNLIYEFELFLLQSYFSRSTFADPLRRQKVNLLFDFAKNETIGLFAILLALKVLIPKAATMLSSTA